MMIKTLQQVETLNATIRRVDREIIKRLKAIRRNVVPNAAIARNHVRTLQRENEQRKAILHLNRTRIEQLYEADGGRYSKMRRTFLTPDGPKEKGNRGRPMVSIEEMNRVKNSEVPLLPPTAIKPSPPTKKQRKRVSPPPKDIEVRPLPIVTPAKPPARLNEAADSVRQGAHRMAADRARAIRRVRDAKRDAELVRKGQMNLVRRRRSRELAKRRQEMKKRNVRMRNQRLEEIKRKAVNAERTARAQANTIATRNVAVSPRRPIPSRGPVRPNGLIPQLALMTALNDKNRAANLNKTTRTQEVVPQGPIDDQITEDVRKFKPPAHSWSKEYKEFIPEIIAAEKQARKMIADALAGREVMGFKIDIKALGRERTKYWVNRAYALIAQVKKVVSDEAIRWDKGSLSAGVNISTESRSQSSRKMTLNEFKRYLTRKLRPIIEPVMNEFMEELKRVNLTSTETVVKPPTQTNQQIPSSAQATHLREVQELTNYVPYYREQAEMWITDFKRTYPSLYGKLMNVPMFVNHLTYPQQRNARIINLFSTKQMSRGNAPSQISNLEFAKTEIEFAWKGLIPLAVSEIKKLEPNYSTTLPNPMPQGEKTRRKISNIALGSLGTSRNINTPVNVQKNLSGIDKLRGHGRPVLSEQQGTKGLAGLFPALRSSMQGALRQ